MWHLNKNDTNELIHRNRLTGTEKNVMVTKGERTGGIN